jgi:hypothetical protein
MAPLPFSVLPTSAQHTDQHDRFSEEVPLMDEAPYYAEAFSPIAGRCFRLVSRQDQQAGPIHCPAPPRWSGSLRDKNGRRYGVEACDGHREPLKNVRLIRRADS